MTRHKRAVQVIAACLVLLLADSLLFAYAAKIPLWHSLYVIMANAETFGGDVGPTNALGYVANTVVLIILIPLFGATISLFTSGLTETRVSESEQRVKDHLEGRLAEHHEALKQHITTTMNGGDAHEHDVPRP